VEPAWKAAGGHGGAQVGLQPPASAVGGQPVAVGKPLVIFAWVGFGLPLHFGALMILEVLRQ
jgi:hypothetical protein